MIPAGVIVAAREVQEQLSRAGFRFCFIGGVALQRWGVPRFTQDVDLIGFEADRGQDRVDVEAIILRRGSGIDWPLVDEELKPLLEVRDGQPSRERLAGLRKKPR